MPSKFARAHGDSDEREAGHLVGHVAPADGQPSLGAGVDIEMRGHADGFRFAEEETSQHAEARDDSPAVRETAGGRVDPAPGAKRTSCPREVEEEGTPLTVFDVRVADGGQRGDGDRGHP